MMVKFAHCLLFVVLYLSHFMSVKCRSRWLTNSPDEKRINELSFIGTHDSATHKIGFIPVAITQTMKITEQLEAGIRVLDMRVRLIDNDFAMHHDRIYLGMMFKELMTEINDFLSSNPEEFIIMIMQEEWKRKGTMMNECQILESKYISHYSNLFVKYWSVSDTISKHRGKILLVKGHRGFGGCTTRLPCREQNNWEISNNYTKDDKWNDIKNLQDDMVNSNNHQRQCYINYLSGNGGILQPPMNICCISTNFVNWLLGASLKVPGMNDRMLNYFCNPKNKLYIVMADFPSTQLIKKIVNSN